MVMRMFLKMMTYLTISVFAVNYLIESRMEIMHFLRPALTAAAVSGNLDEEGLVRSHQLLE